MSNYPSRFDPRPWGGPYDDADAPKFQTNLDKVRSFLIAHIGQWFTKEEIRQGAGLPVGSDSTPRIRDLRKKRFGGWTVEQQRREGHYKYRLIVRTPQEDSSIPF